MPNIIDSNGLQTKTRSELVTEISNDLKLIYGNDINLDPDTPDGQFINIFIQSILDGYDLLTQVYNQFDPDLAFGRVLDQRVAINGIQRQAGTRTVTNITVVTSQAVNLYGVDQTVEPVFTVSDDQGNEWQLIETQNVAGAGTYVYSFQSAVPGEVLTTPNTITNAVTVVLGITSVNNPTTYTTLGIDEETDQDLRLRRQRSVSLASQGYLEGLIAALENITGLTDVFVYENRTGTVDADGIPSHSIWVIVGGTASDEDIATAIYRKRNAGCGMKGSENYTITQVDGSKFVVKWDEVETEDLYIAFDAESLDGVNAPNTTKILDDLPGLLPLGVNEQIDVNEIATLVQGIDDNTLVLNCKVSDSPITVYNPGDDFLSPSAKNKKFSVVAANIDITVV
jgi:uncharacterized phage protein gp47/JayE